jgi:hypothetical protein
MILKQSNDKKSYKIESIQDKYVIACVNHKV